MQRQFFKPIGWQRDFVEKYLANDVRRARLISSIGMGKTTAAQYAGFELLRSKRNSNMLVINSYPALGDRWHLFGSEREVAFVDNVEYLRNASGMVVSTSAQDLLSSEMGKSLADINESASFFIALDDAHFAEPSLIDYIERLLSQNSHSRLLALFPRYIGVASGQWGEFFDSEYIFDYSSVLLPETRLEVVRYSPSYSVLQSVLAKSRSIEDLSWRQFEKLIAELLEKEGYEVELMEGTKDGGVDVVAIKDLGPSGLFKTLWQAKKKQVGNKVGLSVVRELADTRNEFCASKAFIVTSTFLTRGAAQRIQRDRYQLGKVDRNDLNLWIDRIRRAS
ncbi:restriction endonuclease [Burkholderia pseudomultivorans]|nr:restriction endonuclease [Burkholderia pseudomultivorans]